MAAKNATIANLDMNVRAKIDQLEKRLKQAGGQLINFGKVSSGVAASLKRVGEQALGTFTGFVSANVLGRITSGVTGLVGKLQSLGQEQFATILGQESLAAILGVSGNTLRAFTLAAERATLGQGELEGALIRTAKNVKEGNDAIDELGLSYADLALMTVDQQFLAILEALEKIPNANRRVQLAMELWGKSGAQILQATSAGFRQAEGDVRKFGIALGDQALANIDKMHVSITDMMARLKGLANQLLSGLAPTVSSWLDKIGEAWDKIGSRAVAQRVLDVFERVRNSIMDFAEGFINSFGGMEKAILELQKTMLVSQEVFLAPIARSGGLYASLFGMTPEEGQRALEEVSAQVVAIQDRMKGMANTQFRFPSVMRQPMRLPGEPAGPAADPGRAILPPGFAGILGSVAAGAAQAAVASVNRIINPAQLAIAQSGPATPQSFGAVRQGTVEAARAIFDAERAYRDGQKSAEERRHKEAIEAAKKNSGDIVTAVKGVASSLRVGAL